ncbi:gag-aspartyl protease domain-containing protein [Tanacetum coccineum]
MERGFLVPGERGGGGKRGLNTVTRSVDSSSTRNDKHPNTKRKGMPSDDPTGSIAKKIDEKGADIGKHTSGDSSQTLKVPINSSGLSILKMDAMIENDPWLIRNVPLISRKWTPDTNIAKEHVCNIHVWVKFHDIPITVFIEDGLGAIATKLDTPMLIYSYTSAMCTNSWGMSSYVKAMVELRVNVELKDTLAVDIPKFVVENDDGMGTNGENSKLVGKGANSYVVSSAHGTSYEAFGSPNTTPLATRINDLKRKTLDEKLVLVDDDDGKPLKKVDHLVNADSDYKVDEVFNKTVGFMTLTSSHVNKSVSGVRNKSMYEQ